MTDENSPTLDSILLRRRRRTLLRVLAAGLVLVAGAVVFWLRGRDELPAPTPPSIPPVAEVEPAPVPTPAPVPAAEPLSESAVPVTPSEPLPTLSESDPFVRRLAASLSSRPEVVTWLASDELIRRVVAGVDAIAQGLSPLEQVPTAMRPQGAFEVVSSGEGAEIAAPSAHARYDTLAEVVSGLDSQGLVRAYRELQPLFEEAYRDLGHPKGSFDASLRAAIFELLATPSVMGEPLLERRTLGHAFADPALEGLSEAQKHLLRFGPVNALRVRSKLRELALALGIPESELPASRVYTP